jgi:hypothetical protein
MKYGGKIYLAQENIFEIGKKTFLTFLFLISKVQK